MWVPARLLKNNKIKITWQWLLFSSCLKNYHSFQDWTETLVAFTCFKIYRFLTKFRLHFLNTVMLPVMFCGKSVSWMKLWGGNILFCTKDSSTSRTLVLFSLAILSLRTVTDEIDHFFTYFTPWVIHACKIYSYKINVFLNSVILTKNASENWNEEKVKCADFEAMATASISEYKTAVTK